MQGTRQHALPRVPGQPQAAALNCWAGCQLPINAHGHQGTEPPAMAVITLLLPTAFKSTCAAASLEAEGPGLLQTCVTWESQTPGCRARAQQMRSHSYGALCCISSVLFSQLCGSLSTSLWLSSTSPQLSITSPCLSITPPCLSVLYFGILLLFSLAPCPSQAHSSTGLCSSCLMCCSSSLKRPCSSPRPPAHELLTAVFWVLVPLVPGLRMLSLAPCISKGKTGDIPASGTALTQPRAGYHAVWGVGGCFIAPRLQDFPDCFAFWLRTLPSCHTAPWWHIAYQQFSGPWHISMEMCRNCAGYVIASLG